ncbi:hypothetical protein [Candidatus Amarolinea dominans]|uniref:hypothetical protein n=1 Tax=Candidatus Amarolinea dominans TaxID=3140696 RepID=UPI003135469E|nr:hypothetical protein [Anaerolineae bacterium]
MCCSCRCRGSTVSSRRAVDVDQQRAGVWLAQQGAAGRLAHPVGSQPGSVLRRRGIVPMPNGSPAQVLTYADAVQADVLITSPRKLASRPALQAWREERPCLRPGRRFIETLKQRTAS